jgi:hypothetical protein
MFLIAMGLIALMPIAIFWMKRSFEHRRWSESDHPIGKLLGTGEEEDDE